MIYQVKTEVVITVQPFGYLISVSIEFYDFIFPFSLWSRRQKTLKTTSHATYQTPRESSKYSTVFSTLLVFRNVVKHSVLCLMYYIKRLRSTLPLYWLNFQDVANWLPTDFVLVFQRGKKLGCDWKFTMVIRYPVAGFRIVLHLEFLTKPGSLQFQHQIHFRVKISQLFLPLQNLKAWNSTT